MQFSEEKHAELCYTECLFLDALLTFIQVPIDNDTDDDYYYMYVPVMK